MAQQKRRFAAALIAAGDEIDCMELAELAAEGKGFGETINATVSDSLNREITLGHVMVAVFYGSEKAIERALETIKEMTSGG